MRIKIISVGKPRKDLYKVTKDYLERISNNLKIEHIFVKQSRLDDVNSSNEEGLAILKRIESRDYVVTLTRTGRKSDSRDFSKFINNAMIHSRDLCFVIGGASGLSEDVLSKSKTSMSLSHMTLQHDFALLFLSEQIYRAFSIINNSPYHRNTAK